MSKLKYGMAAVGAIAAVGVAGVSLPEALADHPMGIGEASDAMDQQSWTTQRAKQEYGLLKQECETLHYSQPQAYEPCLEKAKSTRENLLTQAQGSRRRARVARFRFQSIGSIGTEARADRESDFGRQRKACGLGPRLTGPRTT